MYSELTGASWTPPPRPRRIRPDRLNTTVTQESRTHRARANRCRCYGPSMSKAEIDGVAAEFFSAFDNRGGKAADVDRVRRLVVPGGVLIKAGPEFTVYTVEEFIEPRQQLLAEGRLMNFNEW